ncbi:hypothetical protein ACFC5X_02890 [Streptomyces sp. NPDC055952]|uniref:hypothetical protein n=1 Tax=Streptomyces sp. NPDC055952 TaxID=3345663 RepID=UPI0035DB8DE8
MGARLDPTPAMRRYRVEVNSRGFTLSRTLAGPATRITRFVAALPPADLDAILAALDQVTDDDAWRRWASDGRPAEPDTSWTADPHGDGEAADPVWSVLRQIDQLTISGPWIVRFEQGLWSARIAYSDTESLRRALTAAV